MTQLSVFFQNARVTELGKIKAGGLGAERVSPAGKKWRAPEKYDHMIVTTLHRSPAGDLIEDAGLMKQLIEQYGDKDGKLRQLPIRVLSNEIDDIMQSAYVWYGGKSVAARSDGHTVTWFYNKSNGTRLPEPVVEDWKPEMLELVNSKGQKLFKLHTTLNVVIAAKEAKWGGVYKLRTTSVISSKQLYQSLMLLHQLTGGILVGMPLMLILRPVQVSPEGKTTTVYVFHIELRGPDLQQLQLQAIEQAKWQLENRQQVQAINVEYKRLMLPPGTEQPSEAAEIAEEFQPENADDVQPVAPPKPDAFWQSTIHGKPAEVVDDQGEVQPTPAERCRQSAENANSELPDDDLPMFNG